MTQAFPAPPLRAAGGASLPEEESRSGHGMTRASEGAAAANLPGLVEPWFPAAEHAERLRRVQSELVARGLDGILLFQPESVTWVTGFYTRGMPRCSSPPFPPPGSRPCAAETSKPTIWNAPPPAGTMPAGPIRTTRSRWAPAWCAGCWDPGRSSASSWRRGRSPQHATRHLSAALTGAALEDASDLVRSLRLVKSPREIAYMRLAGRCAEAGMAAAAKAALPGTSERELAAVVCDAMIRAGSDVPGPGVLSSGEGALHLHGSYTDRVLREGDTVQLETIPCVRHYHARFMRPIKVARAHRDEHAFADGLIAIQDEALASVAPGVPATIPDRLYRTRLLGKGLVERYTNKTFYSVGLLLPPSGGEALEASPAAQWHFRAGMTFHTYLLARGFGLSETILITETGYERLTNFPRRLIVSGA